MPCLRLCAATLLLICGAANADLLISTVEYPPYVHLNNDTVEGVTTDLVREIMRRIKQPIRISMRPWSRALAEAKGHVTDAVYPAIQTPERDAYLLFLHEPLIMEEQVLVARRDHATLFKGDIASLSGQSICVMYGFSVGLRVDEMIRAGKLRRVEDTSPRNCTRLVLAGSVDYYVTDRLVAQVALKQLKLEEQLAIVAPPIEVTPTYLAFVRNSPSAALAETAETALRDMRKDGTYQHLIDAYLARVSALPAH